MGVGDALRDFARFLEDCDGGTVNGVEFTDRLGPEGELEADVELTMGIDATLERSTATVDDAGRLVITFESTTPVVPPVGDDLELDVTDVRLDADGEITVDLSTAVRPNDERERDTEITVEPVASVNTLRGSRDDSLDDGYVSGGSTVEKTRRVGSVSSGPLSTGPEAEESNNDEVTSRRDVPPFEDRELLAEVYESCETFSEMADAIGMDVTGETVRRYMIDHGIHEPNSYNTTDLDGDESAADDDSSNETEEDSEDAEDDISPDDPEFTGDEEPSVVLPDGIGLPEGITVDAIIETVKRSNTIYEVEKNLDVDHETSLEMLREFDLLDLVVGRLATEGERDIEREEIIDRLRQNSANR